MAEDDVRHVYVEGEVDPRAGNRAEFARLEKEFKKARLAEKRSVSPDAKLTPEEKAELYDKAMVMSGLNPDSKADPEWFREKRTPEQIAEDRKSMEEIYLMLLDPLPYED